MVCDLRGLGIKPTDTLLVHSSYKSLGLTQGGPTDAVQALQAAVAEGTLLLPALSYEAVTAASPVFSANDTPCCVGIIPETFRNSPDVVRSVHPTHSVCAWGRLADTLTRRHHQDRTPVGQGSPFRLMLDHNAKILMLGCGLQPNTFMHGVEEAVGTPYVLTQDQTRFEIIHADGQEEEAWHTTHDFAHKVQRYERVEGLLAITKGKVLKADAYVINANALWEAASVVIKNNPLYFVDTTRRK
jgi:aminoglycoside 3-N-acetyltransferase